MSTVQISTSAFFQRLMTALIIRMQTQTRMPAKKDNQDRREHDAQRRNDAACDSLMLPADKSCRIHGNDARRALPDRIVVHQFFFRSPVLLFDNFPLQNRQHGIAAAESHHTDLAESQKHVQINVHKSS